MKTNAPKIQPNENTKSLDERDAVIIFAVVAVFFWGAMAMLVRSIG